VFELLIALGFVASALVGYVIGMAMSRNRDAAQQQNTVQLTSKLAVCENELTHLRSQYSTKEKEIETLNQRLVLEFKNIAQEIVETKGKAMSDESHKNISALLSPLKEKIESFEAKVSQSHLDAMKDNSALRQQLETLSTLNQSIGKEAQNLVNALKGNVKTQGNWGEMILEKILEKSGLERDREYRVQVSLLNDENRRVQPDVVVMLPDNKSIIIDSKVSLLAYELFCSTDDDAIRKSALADHVASIRNHIKILSEKRYQQLYELNSVDFVLMFVPIESAFACAVQENSDLWAEAFEKNIVIVSTSTLLATLRTVAGIWRQEKSHRNALEIARQSGDLYDKFCGFMEDLTKVGNAIGSAQRNYDEAYKKLYTGRGNVIKRLDELKRLGANASKGLPQPVLDKAEDL